MKVDVEIEHYNATVDWKTLPGLTRIELAKHNGTILPTIYVGIRGLIYDVTPNRDSYGVGKGYHAFVGKELTRLLGLHKLKLGENQCDATGYALDQSNCTYWTGDFADKENDAVAKWIEYFSKRYRVVAVILDHV